MCHAFYSRKLIKLVIQSFKLSASKYCYILELYCTVDKCTVSAVTIRAVLTARDEIMGKGKDSRQEGKKKMPETTSNSLEISSFHAAAVDKEIGQHFGKYAHLSSQDG